MAAMTGKLSERIERKLPRLLVVTMLSAWALCGVALAAPTFAPGVSWARFSPHNSELSGMGASRTNLGSLVGAC
jgi:hypothetical protein